MLDIVFSDEVPNGSYFTTVDTEPYIKDGDLILLDGEGTKRSTWSPATTSTIVYRDENIVAIHVGYYHKHRGGQFWRYYRIIDGEFVQSKWAGLTDPERALVLQAYEGNKAPIWAKIPGKLRTERVKYKTGYGFKLVGVRDGKYISLYDGTTEYEIGVTKLEKAHPNHGGGYYFYENYLDALNLKDTGLAEGFSTLAILKVEYGGKTIRYESGKIAASELTPKRLAETISE